MSQRSTPKSARNNNALPTTSPNSKSSVGNRAPSHAAALRLPQSSFARSFSRPMPPPQAMGPLKPPFALDANRGSVSSVYSQSSTAETPPSFPSVTISKKQSTRLAQSNRPRDLSSVHEEEHAIIQQHPRAANLGTNDDHNTIGPSVTVTPRRNSLEREERPLVSPITRTNSLWSRSAVSPEQSARNTKLSRSDTIAALTKAITINVQTPTTPTAQGVSEGLDRPRMPFEESPGSMAIQDDVRTLDGRDESDRMGTIPLYESRNAAEFLSARAQSPTEDRSMSIKSTNPLLDSPMEQSTLSMSDRIPAHKRPPQLNLNIVKESESRGSLTSLPDLIQRATRLASNLDRGKTASRLGLDAMFFSSDKSSIKKRSSTYSDVLFSFPAPAIRVPTPTGGEPRSASKNANTRDLARSHSRLMEMKGIDDDLDDEAADEKSPDVSHPKDRKRRRRARQKRRCCGLSLTVFIAVIVLILLLIAAAVLLPIFLVWLPKQNAAAKPSSTCSAIKPCLNGGVSVVDKNTCACICADGFVGDQCAGSGGPGCITTTISDGTATYENATIGSNILPLLSTAAMSYNVPLNKTSLLSIFAHNNLTCAQENALIQFSVDTAVLKRFIMIPDIEHQAQPPVPLPTKAVHAGLSKRVPDDPPAQTENGVVFAATSTATIAQTSVATATATGSSGAPSPTSATKLTGAQVNFAQVVVLYVLQQLRDPGIALNTTRTLDQYLKLGGPSNGTSAVGVVSFASSNIVANFDKFTITNVDGSVVGGKSGNF